MASMFEAFFTSPRKKKEHRDARDLSAAQAASVQAASKIAAALEQFQDDDKPSHDPVGAATSLLSDVRQFEGVAAELLVQIKRGDWNMADPQNARFCKQFTEVLGKVTRKPGRMSLLEQLRKPNHAQAAHKMRQMAWNLRDQDKEAVQLAMDNVFDNRMMEQEQAAKEREQMRRRLSRQHKRDQAGGPDSPSWQRASFVGGSDDEELEDGAGSGDFGRGGDQHGTALVEEAIRVGLLPPEDAATTALGGYDDMDFVLERLRANSLDRARAVYQSVADANPAIAVCLTAAARCEHARGNYDQEALDWLDAASFLRAVEQDRFIRGGLTLYHEDYAEAVEAFLAAARIHIARKRFMVAGHVFRELAEFISFVGRHGDAAEHYQKAAELTQTNAPLRAADLLQSAVECHFCARDFKGAVSCLVWMVKLVSEVLTHAQFPLYAGPRSRSQRSPRPKTDKQSNTAAPETSDTAQPDAAESAMLGSAEAQADLSVAATLLMTARVSIVLVLCLMGEFSQAQEFAEQLEADAVSAGLLEREGNDGGGDDDGNEKFNIDWAGSSWGELQLLLLGLADALEHRAEPAEIDVLQSEMCDYLAPFQREIMEQIVHEVETFRAVDFALDEDDFPATASDKGHVAEEGTHELAAQSKASEQDPSSAGSI